MHLSVQWKSWSLRCSWSIACRRCSNYIFILDFMTGFNGLGKNNCNMRRALFKSYDSVRLILRDFTVLCIWWTLIIEQSDKPLYYIQHHNYKGTRVSLSDDVTGSWSELVQILACSKQQQAITWTTADSLSPTCASTRVLNQYKKVILPV